MMNVFGCNRRFPSLGYLRFRLYLSETCGPLICSAGLFYNVIITKKKNSECILALHWVREKKSLVSKKTPFSIHLKVPTPAFFRRLGRFSHTTNWYVENIQCGRYETRFPKVIPERAFGYRIPTGPLFEKYPSVRLV